MLEIQDPKHKYFTGNVPYYSSTTFNDRSIHPVAIMKYSTSFPVVFRNKTIMFLRVFQKLLGVIVLTSNLQKWARWMKTAISLCIPRMWLNNSFNLWNCIWDSIMHLLTTTVKYCLKVIWQFDTQSLYESSIENRLRYPIGIPNFPFTWFSTDNGKVCFFIPWGKKNFFDCYDRLSKLHVCMFQHTLFIA